MYSCFKDNKFTDIIFKGFYQTDNQKQADGTQNFHNSNDSSEKASDDESKDEAQNIEESGESTNQSKAAAQESYWREKPKISSTK